LFNHLKHSGNLCVPLALTFSNCVLPIALNFAHRVYLRISYDSYK
jgi:hypothetical protein